VEKHGLRHPTINVEAPRGQVKSRDLGCGFSLPSSVPKSGRVRHHSLSEFYGGIVIIGEISPFALIDRAFPVFGPKRVIAVSSEDRSHKCRNPISFEKMSAHNLSRSQHFL
jgi:hypothetical protein